MQGLDEHRVISDDYSFFMMLYLTGQTVTLTEKRFQKVNKKKKTNLVQQEQHSF